MRTITLAALVGLLTTAAHADTTAHCSAAWKAKGPEATAAGSYKAWNETCLVKTYTVPASATAAPAGAAASSPDSDAIQLAEKAMLLDLKDPDSAKFRGEFVRPAPIPGVTYVCGEVNAKNSYGGYGGFEPFVFFPANAPPHIAGQAFTSDGLKDMELIHPFGAPIPAVVAPDEWGVYLMTAFCGPRT